MQSLGGSSALAEFYVTLSLFAVPSLEFLMQIITLFIEFIPIYAFAINALCVANAAKGKDAATILIFFVTRKHWRGSLAETT